MLIWVGSGSPEGPSWWSHGSPLSIPHKRLTVGEGRRGQPAPTGHCPVSLGTAEGPAEHTAQAGAGLAGWVGFCLHVTLPCSWSPRPGRPQRGRPWPWMWLTCVGASWGLGAVFCPQELEQQLMMEKRNYRKTLKFYQKLLQKEKRNKGKARVGTGPRPRPRAARPLPTLLSAHRVRRQDHAVQAERAAGRNEIQGAVPQLGQEVSAGKWAPGPALLRAAAASDRPPAVGRGKSVRVKS